MTKLCGLNPNDYSESEYREKMIGRSPNKAGRGTWAIYISLKEKVDVFLVGTGATNVNGIPEADWILKYLLDNFYDIIKNFSIFQRLSLKYRLFPKLAKRKIKRISETETDSIKTDQEMLETVKRLKEKEVKKLFVVTDKRHMPRTVRDLVLALEKEDLLNSSIEVYTSFSHIQYKEGGKVKVEDNIFSAQP